MQPMEQYIHFGRTQPHTLSSTVSTELMMTPVDIIILESRPTKMTQRMSLAGGTGVAGMTGLWEAEVSHCKECQECVTRFIHEDREAI